MLGKRKQQQTQGGVETKEVYTMWSTPKSDSFLIVNHIEDMAKKGWRLVGRKNDEGFLGLTATTTLHFARPRRIRGVPTDRIRFDVKTMNIGYCRPGQNSSEFTNTVEKMSRQGWVLAGKTSHEGFLGLTPYTHLVFLRPRL